MAFCSKCGNQIADDAKFCPGCGAQTTAAPAPGQAPVMTAPQSGTGLQRNVAGLLCYLFGWISGLIFYFIEKDRFVRFHAVQSIILFGAIQILQFVVFPLFFRWSFSLLLIWGTINSLLWVAELIVAILLMVKAYNNEMYKLPFIGDLAEKYSR